MKFTEFDTPEKKAQRDALMKQYLAKGGKVQKVPTGQTAYKGKELKPAFKKDPALQSTPITSPMSDESKEQKPSDTQVRQAKGIAFDKRYKGGNYTGAHNTIEKLKKGLTKHPDVADALRRANEEMNRIVDEACKRHKAKEEAGSLEERLEAKLKEDAPFDGMGLVRMALMRKFITAQEWHGLQHKWKDAVAELEQRYDDWPEDQGFGSSDHAYAIKELMELVGYEFDDQDTSGRFVVSKMPPELEKAGIKNARMKDAVATEDAGLTDQQKQGLTLLAKKYSGRKGVNGDPLIRGWIKARSTTGVTSDGWDSEEVEAWEKRTGKELSDWSPEDDKQFINQNEISRDMEDELLKVMGDPDFADKPIADEVYDFLDDSMESAVEEDAGDELKRWFENYSKYSNLNGDKLPFGLYMQLAQTGVPTDGMAAHEASRAILDAGLDADAEQNALSGGPIDSTDVDFDKADQRITDAMKQELADIMGVDAIGEEEVTKAMKMLGVTTGMEEADGLQSADLKRLGQHEPKVYVHKDGKTIMVPKDQANNYIAKGWKKSALRAETSYESKLADMLNQRLK